MRMMRSGDFNGNIKGTETAENRGTSMEEKNKEIVGDMEFLDIDQPVIHEFVKKNDSQRTLEKKRRKREGVSMDWLWPLIGAVVFLAVILCGIFWLRLWLVPVLLVAVLEVVLALCLCRSPLWLHGLVIVLNIVLGVVFQMALYMVLASLIYGAGVGTLYMWRNR